MCPGSEVSDSQEYYLELCQELEKHDYQYYVLHAPLISDYDYDMKMRELQLIEKQHPEWRVPWSPTLRLGDRPSGELEIVDHKYPMLSIANGYSEEELEEFFSRVEKSLGHVPYYTIELKIDGIAVAIRYEDRILVQAMSRGNGKQGEDITTNIRTIRALPLRLPEEAPEFLEVRGEVFFKRAVFDEINAKQRALKKPEFANPRNAAGGTLKLLSAEKVAERKLEISIYSVLAEELSDSHCDSLECCRQWGLSVQGMPRLCRSKEEVFVFLEEIKRLRSQLPMEIDGVVIKVDSIRDQQSLGSTGKHYRWALAYKYAPEQAETVLEDILVQVGRTGVLTPVAKLRPVFLSGSLISRASLYNEEEIRRKDIRIGDTVVLEKGGEVIPKVVGVVLGKRPEDSQSWQMPEHCPICHGDVVREGNKVCVRCMNPTCSGGTIEKIRFFAGRSALDIEYLGEKVINKLFDMGLLHSCSDIFSLTKRDLLQVPGFREKSVTNILKSIEKAKNVFLDRFLVALGIPYVGIGVASSLAEHFGSLERVISASEEELLEIEGIGDKVAVSIKEYFENPKHLEEIEKMLDFGVKVAPSHKSSSICQGKTFVITGAFAGITRSDIERTIRNCGGKVSSSVSKQTDYLVVGEDPGSKLKKAQELGIPLLDQDSLQKLLYNY
ncbi:NAD-dependent DNA ligase [Chlamydia pecorum PV3056/3]|uniref:NAD-dependent DNA ligase LigA n=1 Tax=Chlamydia pecorum TaxID=85991 RepID=UPI0003ADFD66|nr:NAD-dependent DNA ligase LigA [Chlamydia pecorum]AGW38077.1 NAD-dependent DNA ligase [Chlamydia pecorum PV3056/3]